MVTTRRSAAKAAELKSSPTLLNIPLELRQMILDYAFTEVPTITRTNPNTVRSDGSAGGWIPPAVLQTCRQLRADGMGRFRRFSVHLNIHDLDVKHLLAYYDWLSMMRSYDTTSGNLFNGGDGTWIVLHSVGDAMIGRRNLEHWVEQYYNGRISGFLTREDERKCFWRAKPRFILDVHQPINKHKYRVAKIFYAADRCKSQGLAWNNAKDVLEPALDMAFALI